MLTRGLHVLALILLSVLLLMGVCFAIVIHDTVRYERPVRSIRGRVTALGQAVPGAWVDVYDDAQLCLDPSLDLVARRKRQKKVASVEPNARGEFNITHLPKGFYEVEFGNHGHGGYHILSVLLNVDPNGTRDKLCVNLGLEGGPGQNTAAKCGTQKVLQDTD